MQPDSHFISYQGIEIEYFLTRKDVKYVNLRVNKHGIVTVSAPPNVPFDDIEDFVRSKADWIITHMAQLEQIKSHAIAGK